MGDYPHPEAAGETPPFTRVSWTCVNQGLTPGDSYVFSDRDLTGLEGWHCWKTESLLNVLHITEDIARALYYVRGLGKKGIPE